MFDNWFHHKIANFLIIINQYLPTIMKCFSFGYFLENADMDISPDTTPTSEPSYSSPTASNLHPNNTNINSNSLNHDDVMTSPNGHAKLPPNATNSNNQIHHQISITSTSSVSSTSKLNSNSNKNSTATSSSSPSTHNYSAYPSHHHNRHRSTSPNDSASLNQNNIGHDTNNSHHNSNSLRNSPSYSGSTNVTSALTNSVSRLELNNASSNNNNHIVVGDGPPTPEMDLNSAEHRRRKCQLQIVITDQSYFEFLVDAASGVSSLQSVMSAQTSNRLNLLNPSLAKFFRADLISHVTNWPSEILEKQVINATILFMMKKKFIIVVVRNPILCSCNFLTFATLSNYTVLPI
jgi:hypothetical protein